MNRVISKSRIALFLPSLEIGGVERVTLNLAGGLVGKGLAVDLVLTQVGGGYVQHVPAGVRVVDLRAQRVAASLLPLVKYLRTERPFGLISAKEYASVVAIAAREIAGIPTRMVVAVHTTLSAHLSHATGLRERLIVPRLARWLYRRADHVIAVSEGVAEDAVHVLGVSPKQVSVVYNPVVTEDLLALANQPVDHPWFAAGAPPLILSIGRLTVAKDYPTLITAFARVREDRDVHLAIMGDGEERLMLETLVRQLGLQGEVWMPGFVYPPYPYLSRASVFVLSSFWEGLSSVLIEALALGVPVVSTDCPSSPREILCDGRYGRLVPVRDSKALAEAIAQTIDQPNHPEVLKTRATAFSVASAIDGYLHVLGLAEVTGKKGFNKPKNFHLSEWLKGL